MKRISEMINGVGDPMVAMYLRCYLCRVAVKFGADDYDFFSKNFETVMGTMPRVSVFRKCDIFFEHELTR